MIGDMAKSNKKINNESLRIDKFEIRRKVFHIILGLVLSILIYLGFLQTWMVAVIILLGIFLSLNHKQIPIIKKMLYIFDRKEHIESMPGRSVIYLFLGVLLIMLLFDKNIVLASMMIWTFGDSAASLISKHYGKIKHVWNNKKLVEGTVAGIIIGTLTASIFVSWTYALIASIIAMIVESMDIVLYKENLDDNLLIPLISGAVIFLITII